MKQLALGVVLGLFGCSRSEPAPQVRKDDEFEAFILWSPKAMADPPRALDRHECYPDSHKYAGWCEGDHTLENRTTYSARWLKKDARALRTMFASAEPYRALSCRRLGLPRLRKWVDANAIKELCGREIIRVLVEQHGVAPYCAAGECMQSTKLLMFTPSYVEGNKDFKSMLAEGKDLADE